MRNKGIVVLTLLAVALLSVGCSSTQYARDVQGLPGPDGKRFEHLNTNNIAIHLLGNIPLIGNARIDQTVTDFSKAARTAGAERIEIVESHKSTYWWILPPISFLIQPVTCEVAGNAIMP